MSDLAIELSKNTVINKHAIELIEGKQPSYGSIYTLSLMELEILKIYIKTYLITGFIWLSKSLASFLIFFDKKADDSLCLCIDYQDLNNLIIKN